MARGYANAAATPLRVAYTAGSSQLKVNSVTGCPALPFMVKVGDELFQVTDVSGGSAPVLSVFGAQEGTTAADHVKGALAYWGVITAVDMQQLQLATQPQPRDYVRSPGVRAYLASNFT